MNPDEDLALSRFGSRGVLVDPTVHIVGTIKPKRVHCVPLN
jgi:hypothetical protein